MPFANYQLRCAFWPIWVWEAYLQDGTAKRGWSLGKGAAHEAARDAIRNAWPEKYDREAAAGESVLPI